MKKIRVKDIRPEGLEVKDTLEPSILDIDKDVGVVFTAPLQVEAALEKIENNTVLAKTNIQGQYQSFCSRCLEPVEGQWNDQYDLDYEVNPTIEYIDLEDDLRQEILLNLPLRLLCKEDCRGLCLKCGVNLNNEKCECK